MRHAIIVAALLEAAALAAAFAFSHDAVDRFFHALFVLGIGGGAVCALCVAGALSRRRRGDPYAVEVALMALHLVALAVVLIGMGAGG